MDTDYTKYDFSLRKENPIEGLFKVLKLLKPEWNPSNIVVKVSIHSQR